jgi:mycofactocin precursor
MPDNPAEAPTNTETQTDGDTPGLADELLVEEVSIDGMCGVY